MSLFPVRPEEKAETTRRQPASFLVFFRMLPDTQPMYHLSGALRTKTRAASLPPSLLMSSSLPGLLQILPSAWWGWLLPKILQRLSKETVGCSLNSTKPHHCCPTKSTSSQRWISTSARNSCKEWAFGDLQKHVTLQARALSVLGPEQMVVFEAGGRRWA